MKSYWIRNALQSRLHNAVTVVHWHVIAWHSVDDKRHRVEIKDARPACEVIREFQKVRLEDWVPGQPEATCPQCKTARELTKPPLYSPAKPRPLFGGAATATVRTSKAPSRAGFGPAVIMPPTITKKKP